MIKRSLNPRFSAAVIDGSKFTTISPKPWPVGKPIMLFNWSGAAYRSPQIDVRPVMVSGWWPITITQTEAGQIRYAYGMENSKPLWQTEGFDSAQALDEWFCKLVKPGQSITQHLMRFKVIHPNTEKP